mmetsp:Transcript_21556/g.53294  ORF Transcript_21556/g.53294 Transcript_21556/m.53294 type:complete len:83 (-) Transcript_21556:862-1110(-)
MYRALKELGSRFNNQRGDSNRKGEKSNWSIEIMSVTENRTLQLFSVAKGKANKSAKRIPITNANCVKVPSNPRSVGGANSPK